jgi:copper chaperone CopZ
MVESAREIEVSFMDTRIFKISGMTCGGCRVTVERELKKLSPLVSVTLDPPQAYFAGEDSVELDDVRAVLASHPKYKADIIDENIRVSSRIQNSEITHSTGFFKTYFPLFLIAGYISITSFAGADGRSIMGWMTNFMAGFFLVFSFFKFLDLRGFADAFSSYDIIAKRFPFYGMIYPFLELALGLAFLFRFEPYAANLSSFILMGVGSIGVAQAVLAGSKIRCACLGTVLNLPMSTITLVENGLMIVMSVLSLVFMYR